LITDRELEEIISFVKQRSGIDLTGKKVLITGRLDHYLAMNGYASYREYMDAVRSDITGNEAIHLVNSLTTNHTFFMREFDHFEFLRKEILPELKRKESSSRDLRIWSAACSTGQEPYTLAMVLKDFFGLEHVQWDTKVLATDLDTQVIAGAQRGHYTAEQIKDVPAAWKQRYFHPLNETLFEVKPELKKEVIFRQFNLMDPFPFRGKFHVVFLRNVMIYFDDATKRKLINKIYEFMNPGGYLFIGATEFIDRSATRFKYVCPSVFRKA
jgi:chemotaxis protein methyltransferase CheR